jgi:CDP-glucose 4,6-dehydratase
MDFGKSTLEDMDLITSAWQGRNVLVTGHTGFKGGWLSLWLAQMGARVYGLSLNPPTSPNLFETAAVNASLAADWRIDVRDSAALSTAFCNADPDIVFHLAAQPLVLYSYREPVETFAVNLMGTVNVLKASLDCRSVKAVIVVTSDKCYQNRGRTHLFREDDQLGGTDPYSASKVCAEIATAAYRSSFCSAKLGRSMAVATVRAGNVIGGGDWGENRLLPDCVRSLVDESEIVLRNPNAVRPWQHVLDALSGYLELGQKLLGESPGRYGESWNFGPDADDCLTVSEIVERTTILWGRSLPVRVEANQNSESPILRLDTTKAGTILGWHPRWRIGTALSETVNWYRAWNENEDMRNYSLVQIGRYCGKGLTS